MGQELTIKARALGDGVLALSFHEFGEVLEAKRDVNDNKVVLVKVKV